MRLFAFAVLLLAGCVSTSNVPTDSAIIVGHVWNDAPARGFGGVSYYLSAYDSASGTIDRATGRRGIRPGMKRGTVDQPAYEKYPVAAGEYALVVYTRNVGSTTTLRLCPAYVVSVAPGQNAYIGNLVFDRFDMRTVEPGDIAGAVGAFEGATRASVRRAAIPPESMRGVTYGLMVPLTAIPCDNV